MHKKISLFSLYIFISDYYYYYSFIIISINIIINNTMMIIIMIVPFAYTVCFKQAISNKSSINRYVEYEKKRSEKIKDELNKQLSN